MCWYADIQELTLEIQIECEYTFCIFFNMRVKQRISTVQFRPSIHGYEHIKHV